MKKFIPFAALLLCVYFTVPARAGELGLNINGLSYHYNTKYFYDDNGMQRPLNGTNSGLGLEFITEESSNSILAYELGFFKDSLYYTAKYAAVEYKYKFGFCPSLSAGIALVYFDTPSYSIHFGPLPIISFRPLTVPYLKNLSVNMTWFPNDSEQNKSAIAFYLTWYFWKPR